MTMNNERRRRISDLADRIRELAAESEASIDALATAFDNRDHPPGIRAMIYISPLERIADYLRELREELEADRRYEEERAYRTLQDIADERDGLRNLTNHSGREP
jgi:hypothetical protein